MRATTKLIHGDCIEVMKDFPDNSVDSIVTDPPYELGFMGKKWDNTGIAYNVDLWKECLRVLKPGGHLLSFGGTRTYHRMACAIEDAGFEIRDQIQWLYGSGFPKSLDIGKQIDKMKGAEREVIKHHTQSKVNPDIHAGGQVHITMPNNWEVTKGTSEWEGWGTALKPANEPIVLARKPISEKIVAENVLKWGTGGINIDGCRIKYKNSDRLRHNEPSSKKEYGKHGEGFLQQINAKIGGTNQGRFPANVIHDGSDEVVKEFPNTKTNAVKNETNNHGTFYGGGYTPERPANSGSSARFFYCAKASKSERNAGLEGFEEKKQSSTYGDLGAVEGNPRKPNTGYIQKIQNFHPTVKPISLMRYLVRLITPPNGICLDLFMGSGTTGIAANKEGFSFIGIEKEKEYFEIAEKRINTHKAQLQINYKS